MAQVLESYTKADSILLSWKTQQNLSGGIPDPRQLHAWLSGEFQKGDFISDFVILSWLNVKVRTLRSHYGSNRHSQRSLSHTHAVRVEKRIQPLLETVCRFINLNGHLPSDPEVPLLCCTRKRNVSRGIHTRCSYCLYASYPQTGNIPNICQEKNGGTMV